MKFQKLTIITIFLLALSFNGMAQDRKVKRAIEPTVPTAEPVMIEQINNQDILRVASPIDTIRIPLSDDTWNKIENLMQSNVGTGLTLKDIEGADVYILRVTKNMKPGIYFRKRKRTSIALSDEEFGIIRLKEEIPPRNQIRRKNDVIHVYACKTDNCAGPGDMTNEREQARHGQYENEPTIEAQHEARMREQQLHGWSRAKKEALIRGDIETLKQLSKKKDLS